MWARGELGRTHASSARVRTDANLAQIWARDGSGRARRPDALHHWGERWRRASPVGPVRTRGHLQRADASRPHAYDLVRPDRRTGCACSSGATDPDQRVRPEASVHQIWVTDASVRTGMLPPVSSSVGLGPAWQRLNGRELCWSKAGRATWPSVAPPRRFAQRPGIGSLLRRPTHGEVTSMPALGPPCRHPMPSGLFKMAAAGQSSTLTLPSSPLFFSTPP
jgi:hypothetical protein